MCRHDGCRCGCEGGGSTCGCGQAGHFQRRFQTRAEQIAELEAYLEDLKREVQAVEEHLAGLRS